jgi:transposase InsO family protein
VCTFSGWVEAFPTRTEKAQEVVRALLKEIIPRHGIPISIGSDNGPAFVAEVLKQLAKGLKINWSLHTAYWPQSSGKVEKINWTLKTQMSKRCQKTHLTWKQVLPLVLLRVRCSPTKQTGFSPYEILYESPPREI